MKTCDRENLTAINSLNQRGGRMLSLCDLIDAGTLSVDIASELALIVYYNGSFLTAAGPGGVGKTTLMAALLGFLPRATEIITIPGTRALSRLETGTHDHHLCLLVHEIGNGPYFSYLWGDAVAGYFSLINRDRSVASNLHAETYNAAMSQLTGPPLSVPGGTLAKIDFFAFMKAGLSGRRVTEVWYAGIRQAHVQAWKWDRKNDTFVYTAEVSFPGLFAPRFHQKEEDLERQLSRVKEFLTEAVNHRTILIEKLRSEFVAHLEKEQSAP
jgi:hypothetical protein